MSLTLETPEAKKKKQTRKPRPVRYGSKEFTHLIYDHLSKRLDDYEIILSEAYARPNTNVLIEVNGNSQFINFTNVSCKVTHETDLADIGNHGEEAIRTCRTISDALLRQISIMGVQHFIAAVPVDDHKFGYSTHTLTDYKIPLQVTLGYEKGRFAIEAKLVLFPFEYAEKVNK